jgi:hypothetical protein
MATFYFESKVDLIILVDDCGDARVAEKCLSCMFNY